MVHDLFFGQNFPIFGFQPVFHSMPGGLTGNSRPSASVLGPLLQALRTFPPARFCPRHDFMPRTSPMPRTPLLQPFHHQILRPPAPDRPFFFRQRAKPQKNKKTPNTLNIYLTPVAGQASQGRTGTCPKDKRDKMATLLNG